MAMLLKNCIISMVASLSVIGITFCSLVSADESGTATFNTPPYVPSACYGYQDEGVMIAAASDPIYNNGAACGTFYRATCISGTNKGTPFPCRDSGSVAVKIVDRRPSGSCKGNLDLSQEAFSSIADLDSGSINISYRKA